jgi:hypothetical protein
VKPGNVRTEQGGLTFSRGRRTYSDLVYRLQRLIGWILGNYLECSLRLLLPFFIVFHLKIKTSDATLCRYIVSHRQFCGRLLWNLRSASSLQMCSYVITGQQATAPSAGKCRHVLCFFLLSVSGSMHASQHFQI